MKKIKAQQEIVGFVLIVVLVIVIGMIFLLISLRKTSVENKSVALDNLLSSVLEYTTQCAVVYEPQYSSVQDLIKNCYENKNCENLDKSACQYLNETLVKIIKDLTASEASMSAYSLSVVHKNNEQIQNLMSVSGGNCTGSVFGSQKEISAETGILIIRISVC